MFDKKKNTFLLNFYSLCNSAIQSKEIIFILRQS